MKQYETFELHFHGPHLTQDYADIPLWAEFVCDGASKTVKGFYDGDGIYRVRFLPQKSGAYTWRVWGIVQAAGQAYCEAADGIPILTVLCQWRILYPW